MTRQLESSLKPWSKRCIHFVKFAMRWAISECRVDRRGRRCSELPNKESDSTLTFGLQYLSAPNTVAFALYFENPIPASPFNVVAGQQGRVDFEVVSGDARYSNMLSNSEVEVILEGLPSPSTLSDGDVLTLRGKLVLNQFTLPLDYAWGDVPDQELALMAGVVDVDCEAEYMMAEVVY